MNFDACLLIVDVQEDFVFGSLAMPGAADHWYSIYKLAREYSFSISSADAHKPDTPHFRKHPKHCVVGTRGATILVHGNLIALKGTGDADDYSLFDGFIASAPDKLPLDILRQWGVTEVHVVGYALDICVKATALNAVKLGFDTVVLKDYTLATRWDARRPAMEELRAAGVAIR